VISMKSLDNALNVLAAKTYRGVGRAWIVKNLKGNDPTSKIVELLNESAKTDSPTTPAEFDNARSNIKKYISKLVTFPDGVVAIGDSEFPSCRGNVKRSDQPVVLFYRGDISLLGKGCRNIAVIGLLNPDKETEAIEEEMVSKLVSHGATIVSGLALGCDTIAHRQALLSGGKTIAILPSPLYDILPSENRRLAEDIVDNGGLLVTEYCDKVKSRMEQSGRYQERDRLQALFSDCVILTASYAKNDLGLDSGSRLAMEYALKYSIQRAVVYDPQNDFGNNKYDLNRQIIREQDGITIINRANMDHTLCRIMNYNSQQPTKPIVQATLFG